MPIESTFRSRRSNYSAASLAPSTNGTVLSDSRHLLAAGPYYHLDPLAHRATAKHAATRHTKPVEALDLSALPFFPAYLTPDWRFAPLI